MKIRQNCDKKESGPPLNQLEKLQVKQKPLKPLILYDGYCGFCRKWVGRWRILTGEKVVYEPYQEAANHYPEISPERLTQSLHLIQTDGQVFQGAQAVLKSLESVGPLRWLGRCYERSRFFSSLSEWLYQKVSDNRRQAWMNKPCCKHE